jgi:hypothetical protein
MSTDDPIPTESDADREKKKYDALTQKVRETAEEINDRIKVLTDEFDIPLQPAADSEPPTQNG